MQRGPLSEEQKEERAQSREKNAERRADDRARRRAEALRTRVGYLRPGDVAAVLGVHGSTLWRWHKAGAFPAPARLATGVVVWEARVVAEWMAERAKGASQAA